MAESFEPSLSAALRALAATPVLLIALDFDGTLAPLVDDAMAARMLPDSAQALAALAELPDTRIAFVSGRSIDSLEIIAEGPPAHLLLVGSHGAELRVDGERSGLPVSEQEREQLFRLIAELEAMAGPLTGVLIERKPTGVGVHTRLADDATTVAAIDAATLIVAQFPSVTLRVGKDLIEYSIHDANKGEGVEHVRRVSGATAVLFAGDDITDEDGFAVMGPDDVGIKVGPGPTKAAYRVADTAAMSAVLAALLQLRSDS